MSYELGFHLQIHTFIQDQFFSFILPSPSTCNQKNPTEAFHRHSLFPVTYRTMPYSSFFLNHTHPIGNREQWVRAPHRRRRCRDVTMAALAAMVWERSGSRWRRRRSRSRAWRRRKTGRPEVCDGEL